MTNKNEEDFIYLIIFLILLMGIILMFIVKKSEVINESDQRVENVVQKFKQVQPE